ncbi:MAG: PIG-L family deacetylase [Flavobacteriaceae bacterium]|nr:PIG-L family deacetylase [Flavobacteriaceae bacterium]
MKQVLILLFSLMVTSCLLAQPPQKWTSSQIYEAVQKLNFLGSVLYVAAHPDDENTRLIAYMSNHIKARTAYLSLTRGSGGQNLIGPEISALLGVIRTQELLAARRVDGGEQFFSRAKDFGYSKHPDETHNIWDKDSVLADVVWTIRNFKPDVIINRFDHRTPGRTHGHHTSSAMLSLEAFEKSNDPNSYSYQLNSTEIWQPKRIFFNTSWWFYGSQKKFKKADKSNMLHFDVGVYYPQKGLSNNELAAIASSQHLCQGFGRLTTRGTQKEYVEFLKGDPPKNNDIFDGIDTTWNRLKGGNSIATILKEVENNFNFKDPSIHLPQLIAAYKHIENLENKHWKNIKKTQILKIIEACAGLYLEATTPNPTATPNTKIKLHIEALNRSNAAITLTSITSQIDGMTFDKTLVLPFNQKQSFSEQITLKNIDYSTPYWLSKKGTLGMYKVEHMDWIGQPETPRPVQVDFDLIINGTPITISKHAVYRYSEPDKGEMYKPFEIIPEVSVSMSNKVYIFEDGQPKDIEVTIKASGSAISGFVSMEHPKGWRIYPEKQKVEITNKGDEKKLIFTIIPPENQSEGYLKPMILVHGKTYSKELVDINYAHIPFQTVLLHSTSKVVRLDIKKRGKNIAYIEGAGDTVAQSLENIGYHITTILPENISEETLAGFDAVVLGIRAYNIIEDLKFKQKYLFDFVANGGNMIVQYNKNKGLKTTTLAPYELRLSKDRVTDENAKVRILEPSHELLNYPNKITNKDFEGWTQERGLYFPDKWGKEFTPLLAFSDKGEKAKKGSLLVAKYGKGHYIYTGLSFFREFPAGVSGAYRLFANMLSMGKKDTIINKKTPH